MARYILRRLMLSIPILLGVTIITFLFVQLVPGDYIDTLVDPEKSGATRQDMAELEEQLAEGERLAAAIRATLRGIVNAD